MKVQDKIYVREYDEGIDQMWRSAPSSSSAAIAQHEYIRKGLLTEKLTHAKELRKKSGCNPEDLKAFDALLEIINSL